MLKELLNKLIEDIEWIKKTMIDTSTGRARIKRHAGYYWETYANLEANLTSLEKIDIRLEHKNKFRDLWDWYGYWSRHLHSYKERRQFVADLYEPLLSSIQELLKTYESCDNPLEEIIEKSTSSGKKKNRKINKDFKYSFEQLHAEIVEKCEEPFVSGHYKTAIFNSMCILQNEVNNICEDSRLSSPARSLYAQANDFFNSEVSYWFLGINEPEKAFECLCYASLLLKMLEETMFRRWNPV